MTPSHESERDRVIEVAPCDLSPEALRGHEVMRQLRDCSAKIVFDPENATIQLRPVDSD